MERVMNDLGPAGESRRKTRAEKENAMKLKKRLWGTALAAVLFGLFAPSARAANPGSLTVKVTVNIGLSVALGSTVYDFGTINAGQTVASTAAVVVTNDSGGRTEDYTINASTFMATGGANWNISGTLIGGANQFGMCAALNTVALSTTAFVASDCLSSNTASGNGAATWMSATQFAGNQNGKSVPSAANENLWLYFAAPTSLTGGGNVAQSVTVTITANDVSLF
jgi:hypothetical protein